MDFNSTMLTVLSGQDQTQNPNASSYVLNGKIMLCSVIVLFVVVVILVCFHSYARWHFHLHHGDRDRDRHRRAHQLFFFSSSTTNTNSDISNKAQAQALDLSVLKRIPTFVYSSNKEDRVLDCVVCLLEFEDNEKGRVLPVCKHAFHVDCIDMWFQSHSNCPLCRTPVQVPPVEEVVSVSEPAGSVADSELGVVHQMGCSSSFSSSLRPLELVSVLVEIQRGNFRGFDDMGLVSNNEGNRFKSPGNRVLTLKRILSI